MSELTPAAPRFLRRAQFRQNRTILNSANPRLMNASFLKGSLIKSPVEQLRGSHSSRGSRAPSLSSLQRSDNGTDPAQQPAPPPYTAAVRLTPPGRRAGPAPARGTCSTQTGHRAAGVCG